MVEQIGCKKIVIPKAIIVVGLGYGDEGKGSMVDFLARHYGASLVVRYNGGPQAAHNVCLSDGRHHTFAQLGSASFTGAYTHLSKFMLMAPLPLNTEIQKFSQVSGLGTDEIYRRITMDPRCVVIHPLHQVMNQIKETERHNKNHGSCGMGIGECRRHQVEGKSVLYAGDLRDINIVARKIKEIGTIGADEILSEYNSEEVKKWIKDYHSFEELFIQIFSEMGKHFRYVTDEEIQLKMLNRVTIFEGAQGVLLDEKWGFAPYNTWTNTTTENARTLIGDMVPFTTVGVIRTYSTRHGPGPFVSENNFPLTEKFNTTGEWQGRFRVGHFDMVANRYAIKHSGGDGLDAIALTHMDQVKSEISVVDEYTTLDGDVKEIDGLDTLDLMCAVPKIKIYPVGVGGALGTYQKLLGDVPITFSSYGSTEKDKRENYTVERKVIYA